MNLGKEQVNMNHGKKFACEILIMQDKSKQIVFKSWKEMNHVLITRKKKWIVYQSHLQKESLFFM